MIVEVVSGDVVFGVDEALRMLLVALAAINIGTLAGRIRYYLRAHHALRKANRTADADTAAAVVTFFAGYLVILASMAWRIVQLYHAPASVPLVVLAVGMLVSLVGMRRMAKHVTPQILSAGTRDLLIQRARRRRD